MDKEVSAPDPAHYWIIPKTMTTDLVRDDTPQKAAAVILVTALKKNMEKEKENPNKDPVRASQKKNNRNGRDTAVRL